MRRLGKIEDKLQQLGLSLPEVPVPIGNYKPTNREANLLYTSGQGSRSIRGQVGAELSIEQGYEAAQEAALGCLAAIKAELGSLDRVKKILKVLGFINSAPGFGEQPAVLNGCSDLLVKGPIYLTHTNICFILDSEGDESSHEKNIQATAQS